jgi:hypothetical protein
MNPQDLLYTNQFVATNIINKENLQNETKYYKNFQDHTDKTANITKKYLDRNNTDGTPLNVNKIKSNPWPPTNEKNYKPIFSNAVSDIVENKYIKAIRTIISIYSKDRNKEKSLIPNDYIIKMGKEFINIYKIKLVDLNIPNTIPPVNHSNNVISWLYPTNNLLNYTVTGNSLYPFLDSLAQLPKYFFYYSSLNKDGSLPKKESSVIKVPDDVYNAVIDEGFYNTNQLESELKTKMNNILHTVNEGIVSSYKNLSIGYKSNYSNNARLIRNTCHNFDININPYTSICTIINRAEELKIIAIQTIPQTTMYSPVYKEGDNYYNDIFWNFFYYRINPTVRDIDPENYKEHVYDHNKIMSGKYLFNRDYIFPQYSNYLISHDGDELLGAELDNMAPSFIITVKDIGELLGGVNINDYYNSFLQFTNEDKNNYETNCYPIIFTNMPSVGGISKNLINYVEFFDLYFLSESVNITNTTTDYDRLKKVTSFYYHFDNIRVGTEIFKRYAFYIHTNSFLNRIGYYFKRACFINAKTQENIIISKSLYNVMGNNKNCNNATYTYDEEKYTDSYDINYQDCFCTTETAEKGVTSNIISNSLNICFYGDWMSLGDLDTMPICGRGLPFAFKSEVDLVDDYNNVHATSDKSSDNCNGKLDSILTLLGWSDNNAKNISNYSPFKFIHKNIDTIETNTSEYSKITKINPGSTSTGKCNNIGYNFSVLPQNLLNIEQISKDIFVFRSIPFIFLKISFPSLSADTVSDQLIKTSSDELHNSNIYDEYYDNPLSNLNNLGSNYQKIPLLTPADIEGTGEVYGELVGTLENDKNISDNCGFKTTDQLLKKNAEVLFAKINMNPVPGNAFNKVNNEYEYIFYDKPLQSINEMKVELLSPDGKLLNLRNDHNITLEIMEFRDVLKETLFDTRHGEVVTTGIKKV